MIELLFGFGLGALALTSKGHEIGNQIGKAVISAGKKVLDIAKPTEQPPGAPGDDSNNS